MQSNSTERLLKGNEVAHDNFLLTERQYFIISTAH
jgi:hypothetical protein